MANESQQDLSTKATTGLTKALETLLRPLVKLLLSFQITYPQLINLLKSIYVEVADTEFSVKGKRQSDSRITLLTGVHRKDVKRLRSEEKSVSGKPASVSVGAQLIGHWLGTEEFLDDAGAPLALPLRSSSPKEASFEGLVERVCKQDIRPRVILDEWLRLGIASISNDRVVLNKSSFTPKQGFDEKAFFFGKNTRDHISASSHNLLDQKPSYFDRSVYYDQLSEKSIAELAELAEKLGMEALTEMNKQALAKQKKDSSAATANYRMNFGVFNFNEEKKSRKNDEPRD